MAIYSANGVGKLRGHARATLYREVVFEYRSKYITQTPLGRHRVAS